MKAHRLVVEVRRAGGIPAELLLGPLIELWADEQRPAWWDREQWSPRIRAVTAHRNWMTARDVYLDSIGLPWPRRTGTIPAELASAPNHPWSFEFCAERYPEMVQARLERAGLPPDWRPPGRQSPPKQRRTSL